MSTSSNTLPCDLRRAVKRPRPGLPMLRLAIFLAAEGAQCLNGLSRCVGSYHAPGNVRCVADAMEEGATDAVMGVPKVEKEGTSEWVNLRIGISFACKRRCGALAWYREMMCDAAKAEPEAFTRIAVFQRRAVCISARIAARYRLRHPGTEWQELLVATSASATSPAHWCEGAASV
jgi:hypothetical protein